MEPHLHLLDKLMGNLYGDDTEGVKAILSGFKETIFDFLTAEEVKIQVANKQKILFDSSGFGNEGGLSDKALHFLETYFPDYVNDELPLSNLGKKILSEKYAETINETNNKFKDCLSVAMYETLNPLLFPNKYPGCTIRFSKYLDYFWRNWTLEMGHSKEKLKEADVIEFLVTYNYNKPTFFKYMTSQMVSQIDIEDSPMECERVLIKELRKVKQTLANVGHSFSHELPHIKTLLEDWLKIEINKCRSLSKVYDPNQLGIYKQNVKLETSLSVSQLAFLFRLLKDTDLILNTVPKDIFNILNQTFSTQQVETITVGSLKNKYYNVEDMTRGKVKHVLIGLLKELEKY